MSETLLKIFDKSGSNLSLPNGARLFSKGDKTNGKMYVLLEGQAEVLVNDTMVELIQPGSVIGELAMIDQEPRSADIRCVKDCMFAEIDEERFFLLIQKNPGFALEVMKALAARLRRANRMI
jgi:CRP/FNR family transcriptional regulator, cyclic AMP receptor protein